MWKSSENSRRNPLSNTWRVIPWKNTRKNHGVIFERISEVFLERIVGETLAGTPWKISIEQLRRNTQRCFLINFKVIASKIPEEIFENTNTRRHTWRNPGSNFRIQEGIPAAIFGEILQKFRKRFFSNLSSFSVFKKKCSKETPEGIAGMIPEKSLEDFLKKSAKKFPNKRISGWIYDINANRFLKTMIDILD